MNAEPRRVLVTGATGKIGRRVVSELTPHVQVRALTRNAASAGLPGVAEITEGDLTDERAMQRALVDVDTVFLLWPLLSAEEAKPVVAAIARHAKRVVYLSTAGAGDPADRASNAISATHHAVEQSIEGSLAHWTMVRPTSFASNALLNWAGQTRSGDTVRWPFADARLSLIHDGDIAAVIARALLDRALSGRRLLLTGPSAISQKAAISVVGRTINRPLAFEEITVEVAREQMLGGGMPAAVVDGVLGYWASRVLEPEPVTDTVADVIGTPARSFSEWVAENADEFG
ncbi:MAG: NAD(P)H-binding protein [Mycobacterium sp.]